MYAGKIVEEAPVRDLFASPRHPYTQGLLASIPRVDRRRERLVSIEGVVPNPFEFPEGCRFAARCGQKLAHCERLEPPVFTPASGHRCACWLYGEPPMAPREGDAPRQDISTSDGDAPHAGTEGGSP
jgi:oligopeptide/dipeptide ABC transporter ATP-binding protein